MGIVKSIEDQTIWQHFILIIVRCRMHCDVIFPLFSINNGDMHDCEHIIIYAVFNLIFQFLQQWVTKT